MSFVIFQVMPNSMCGLGSGIYVGHSNDGGDSVQWSVDSLGNKSDYNIQLDEHVVLIYGAHSTVTYKMQSELENTMFSLQSTLSTLQNALGNIGSDMTMNSSTQSTIAMVLDKLTALENDQDQRIKDAVKSATDELKAKIQAKYVDIGSTFWDD